jgi:methionyl-tRNA formyltransferase
MKVEIKDNKLRIIKIKPEGKNEMDFEDFLRGNHDMEKSIQKII